MENKLLSYVEIEIGGELRRLKFNIGAIEELESMLPVHNAFLLMQKEYWSVSDIISATYCGLKTFDRKLAKVTVQKWVEEYAKENDITTLRLYVFSALGLSGILTKDKSAFAEILAALKTEVAEADEEEEPGK